MASRKKTPAGSKPAGGGEKPKIKQKYPQYSTIADSRKDPDLQYLDEFMAFLASVNATLPASLRLPARRFGGGS